jgi:hypothetical protein
LYVHCTVLAAADQPALVSGDPPPYRLDTEGVLVAVPGTIRGRAVASDAVHAAAHLLANALPVVVARRTGAV